MKTKYIPSVIMLSAGAIACIVGLKNNFDTSRYLITVLTVLVVFEIVGVIAQKIVIKITEKPEEEETETEEEIQEEKEDLDNDEE